MAGPIRIAVLADAGQARRELGGVAQETSSLGSKLGQFGKAAGVAAVAGLAVAGAAAVKFGADSVKAASDAQQSMGATETVFGKSAQSIIDNSNKAARAVGLSANQYRENANVIGSLFSNKGLKGNELAKQTDLVIQKGADLSATFGGSATEAVEALSSAFKGEFDPLERYGVSLKASTINTAAAALAQKQYGKNLDELSVAQQNSIQRQATMNLINEQSAKTQGAFSRETGTLAHQQQVLGAQFENIKAKVGTALLPILTQLLTFLSTNIGPAFATAKAAIGTFAEVLAPAVAFVKRLFEAFNGSDQAGSKMDQLRETVAAAWAAIKSIFSSAVAIIQALWKTFGSTIVSYLRSTFTNLMTIVRGGFKVIQGIFNVVAGLLKGDWSRVWDGIKQILSGAWSVIKGVVQQGWNVIRSLFSAGAAALKGLFSGLWNALKSLASAGLNGVKSLISSGWNAVKNLTSSAWNSLKGLVSAAWNALKGAVRDGIEGAVTLVRSLPGKIKSALGNLGSLLISAGASIIDGLVSGISGAIHKVTDILSSVTDKIPDWKGPADRDKNLLRPAGELIMGGLVKGIQDGSREVERELNRVTGMVAKSGEDLGRTTVKTIRLADPSLHTMTDWRVTARGTTARPATISASPATTAADRAANEQTHLLRLAAEQQINELRSLVGEIRGLRSESKRAPAELARLTAEHKKRAGR